MTIKLLWVVSLTVIVSIYLTLSVFTGGTNPNNYSDEILQYNPSQDKWTTLGRMKKARYGHGLSVINCQWIKSEKYKRPNDFYKIIKLETKNDKIDL